MLPDVPEEVLQYREPVDPSELLAGLTLEKLNAIYQSIIRRQEDRGGPHPKPVSAGLKKKKSVFQIKCLR